MCAIIDKNKRCYEQAPILNFGDIRVSGLSLVHGNVYDWFVALPLPHVVIGSLLSRTIRRRDAFILCVFFAIQDTIRSEHLYALRYAMHLSNRLDFFWHYDISCSNRSLHRI